MKLCLGTAQFQNSYGFKKVFIKDKDQVLNYCLSNGINSFDTSTEYGNALEYLSKYKIEKIDIYLKIKIDTSQNLQTIVDDIQKNLNYCIKNLGEKNIRGLLFHRPQDFIHLDEKSLKLIFSLIHNEYSIYRYGFSFYEVAHFHKLFEKCKFNFAQIPYNILNQEFFKTNLFDLSKLEMEIHVRSIFLQGLLLNEEINIKNKNLFTFIQRVKKDLLNKNVNVLDACVGFVKKNKSIDKIVFGVENRAQLVDISNSFDKFNLKFDLDYNFDQKYLLNPNNW